MFPVTPTPGHRVAMDRGHRKERKPYRGCVLSILSSEQGVDCVESREDVEKESLVYCKEDQVRTK